MKKLLTRRLTDRFHFGKRKPPIPEGEPPVFTSGLSCDDPKQSREKDEEEEPSSTDKDANEKTLAYRQKQNREVSLKEYYYLMNLRNELQRSKMISLFWGMHALKRQKSSWSCHVCKSTGSRGAKLLVPNFKSGATSAKWSLTPEMPWHQNSVGVVWHQNSGAIAFFFK
ncbi:hypothetical protein Tco_0066884 [Tanacetum coccineum]